MNKDITGEVFGRLVAVKRVDDYVSPNGHHHSRYECLCDCGETCIALKDHLISGRTTSCGCKRREPKKRAYWDTDTRLYRVWGNMKNRCMNPNNPAFPSYGGRGIRLCDDWKSYENFMIWAEQSGYNDALTIDRIDNDGDYCPENCRWADVITQANNKRSNVVVEYLGESLTLAELAAKYSIPYKTLHNRVNKCGW